MNKFENIFIEDSKDLNKYILYENTMKLMKLKYIKWKSFKT